MFEQDLLTGVGIHTMEYQDKSKHESQNDNMVQNGGNRIASSMTSGLVSNFSDPAGEFAQNEAFLIPLSYQLSPDDEEFITDFGMSTESKLISNTAVQQLYTLL